MIDLIKGYNRTVVWADDRVLLSPADIKRILDANPAETPATLWTMDAGWAQSVANGEMPEDYPDNSFAESAVAMVTNCRQHGFNLRLVDFRTAHQIMKEGGDHLYLLDLQNVTQALGWTELSDGTNDSPPRWNWLIYGAELAKHYHIPRNRYRFCTRFRGEKRVDDSKARKIEDIVMSALLGIFRNDADVMNHSLRLDNIEELQTGLGEFLAANTLHGDPKVNDAIMFACFPPFTHWHHDFLQPQFGPEGQEKVGILNECIREWLSLDQLDGLSAKSIFRSDGDQRKMPDWQVKPMLGYLLTVGVFEAICTKLGFAVQIDNSVGDTMRLPTQPGLPFLLALAVLVWQMNEDEDHHGPRTIHLSKVNDPLRYTLRLALARTRKRDQLPVDFKKFETAWNTRNGNMTVGRLTDLLHGRLVVTLPPAVTQATPFFNGTNEPAVSIMIETSETPAIVIEWPPRNL